jgi:cytoskeletal protein CcmA (bactofilin family)
MLVAATVSCGGPGSTPQGTTQLGDDKILTGSSAYIRDSIVGDAIVAGGDVDFLGATGGDYLGAGGRQSISGTIHGSLRAAGGSVETRATVDRNATLAGGKIIVDSGAVIGQNAYITGGEVQVNGIVRGGLVVSAGSVTLNGVVGHDVMVTGGELRVGPSAQIAGALRYRVRANKVHIDSAARITGTVTALPVESEWGLRRWLWMLGVLIAGAAVVALFPGFTSGAAALVPRRPILAVLVGLVAAIVAPIVMAILGFTFVGLPLALIALAIWLVLVFLGDLPVAVWVGRRLLGARQASPRYGVVVAYLIGGVIFLIVGVIPVIGKPVLICVAVVGLGATLLQAWGSQNRKLHQGERLDIS